MQFMNGRTVHQGQAVDVYYHFRKKRFSVRDRKSHLVLGHAESVTLVDAVFHVTKGRERVLANRQKNVHAWVSGTFVAAGSRASELGLSRFAYYEPYTTAFFTDADSGAKVEQAALAHCEGKIVYYQ